jgi:hypothetical protein
MNKQSGPSFKVISSCEGCLHLVAKEHIKNSYLLTDYRCNSLQKDLHGSSLTPLEDCPFKSSSKIEFLESTTRKIKEQELAQIEAKIFSIFQGFNFEKDEYSDIYYFRCSETVSGTQIKQLEEKFPNYDLSVDAYSSDTITITISKSIKI